MKYLDKFHKVVPKNKEALSNYLVDAVLVNNIEMVDFFIEHGTTIWNTAVIYAAMRNFDNMVYHLHSKGAKITPLVLKYAITNKNTKLVSFVYKELDLSPIETEEAMIYSIRTLNLDIIEICLKNSGKLGYNVLQATLDTNNLEVVKIVFNSYLKYANYIDVELSDYASRNCDPTISEFLHNII